MSGYDALDELYERLRDAEETQHAQRAGGITPETIRAARGGVADGHVRECHVVDENAAGGDSEPLAGDSRDSRERIEADAWEAARLDMSRTWEERRDAIVALLDRQAALTEREACAYCDYKDANRRQAHKIHEVCKCLEDSHKHIAELQAKVDELNAQNTRLNAKWAAANTQVEKLRARLDEYVEPPDSWERICADLRAMDAGNLIALGNGQYVEDTRHDEIAERIERMARA